MDYVNITEIFLEYLKMNHTGKEKAAQSRYLENKFYISARNVRNIVNALRCDGKPICSDESGYYYAANEEEVMSSIRQLNSRIDKIAKAKNGLINAMSLLHSSRCQINFKFWIVCERG